MPVNVTKFNPNYHISLTDGITTLGLKLVDARGNVSMRGITRAGMKRTGLLVSSGDNSEYSNFESPYSVTLQRDWAGGRGLDSFEQDKTRYYDSSGVDTISGDIILGPKQTETTGYYYQYSSTTRNADYTLTAAAAAVKISASSITPAADIALKKVRFQLKKKATGATYPMKVRVLVYSDSTGPGTELASSDYRSLASADLSTTVYKNFDFIVDVALTASTKYWIAIELTGANSVYVGKNSSVTGNAIYGNTGSWASESSNQALAFTLYSLGNGEFIFFEYKGAEYAVSKPDDFGTPGLFMNGYRGVAKVNATDKSKLNTSLNLTGVDLTGKIAVIVEGPGKREMQPWRVITGNTSTGTNDVITVNPKWKVAHTTATAFVILGCDTWQEVTGHGLTAPVTAVLETDGIIYFAQDYDTASPAMQRMQWTVAAGHAFAADGTNKARQLIKFTDESGKLKVVRSSDVNKISTAAAAAWGTALSFGTAVTCGSTHEQITGLVPYGSPAIPYVMKTSEIGAVRNGVYATLPLSELATVKSELNGRANAQHDVYLYMSILEGLQRFYNGHLDNIGPDRDRGLPEDRQGSVKQILVYPGRLYIAYDAGDNGYSTVMCYNNRGWCEIYRAPLGQRIRRIDIQVMPGTTVDRMWVSQETEIVWLPIAPNPLKQDGYPFMSEGHLISGWITGDMADVNKFWDWARLVTENCKTTTVGETVTQNRYVELFYQTNDEKDADDWHYIDCLNGDFNTSPLQELNMTPDDSCSGYRLRYKVVLHTDDGAETPVVRRCLLGHVDRVDTKHAWNVRFSAGDLFTDLNGVPESLDVAGVYAVLDAWADSRTYPTPLTLNSPFSMFNNKKIFIDPASLNPQSAEFGGEAQTLDVVGSVVLMQK